MRGTKHYKREAEVKSLVWQAGKCGSCTGGQQAQQAQQRGRHSRARRTSKQQLPQVQPPSRACVRPAVSLQALSSRSVAVGGLPTASGDNLCSTASKFWPRTSEAASASACLCRSATAASLASAAAAAAAAA